MGPVLEQLSAQSAERAAKGIQPPKWVYAYVISDIENLLRPDNAVIEDIEAKAARLDAADADKARIVEAAKAAWNESAAPAYARLLAELRRQQAGAPPEDRSEKRRTGKEGGSSG